MLLSNCLCACVLVCLYASFVLVQVIISWGVAFFSFASKVPRHWSVQTGRGPGRDLRAQTGWRLGGQGAWHIRADPARRLGSKVPRHLPVPTGRVRAGICPYTRVGVWAVREPSISGPIRPGGLAPRSRGICVYKWTARPRIWIAISVDSPGGNVPILLARPQYWVQDTWQV